jgi:hypothetical protein
MRKTACCLVAALFVAVSGSCCLATAYQIGMMQHNPQIAYSQLNSESNHRQVTSADRQTDGHSRATSSPDAASGVILEFQSASPSILTQSDAPSTTANTTRITVPISRVDNASNIGPSASKGFTLPTWLIILGAVLVLLMVFGLFFLRLIREGARRPNGDAPAVLVVKPTTPARAKETLQTPIKTREARAERRESAPMPARPRRLRRIPIDAPEEEEPKDGYS